MKTDRILSLLLFAALTGTASSAPTPFTIHEGLIYSTAGLKMDLFVPESKGAKSPCIIVIQGGGFLAQNGKRFRPFAVHLAEHGFAAALIAYRGRPQHTYPTTMEDVRSAVRFVRRDAAKHGIDPEKIGAMGRSAGATLAALLAVGDETGSGAGEERISSRIQAAVGLAGVYDFIARFTDPEQLTLQPRSQTKLATNGEWIGEAFSITNAAWLDASMVNHIDSADPPVLFIHCRDDGTVPWQQSRDAHAKMKAAGIAAELALHETGGHSCRPRQGPDPLDQMVAFFRRTLDDGGVTQANP